MTLYTVELTEEELLMLSAAGCTATICAGNPHLGKYIKDKADRLNWAKGAITLLDNIEGWNRLNNKFMKLMEDTP